MTKSSTPWKHGGTWPPRRALSSGRTTGARRNARGLGWGRGLGSWIERINYETKWLSRERLASISYDAIDAMTVAKRELGVLPRGIADELLGQRAVERDLVFTVAETYRTGGREKVVKDHGSTILAHNAGAFRAGVRDQLFPIPRTLDNRWFDEFETEAPGAA